MMKERNEFMKFMHDVHGLGNLLVRKRLISYLPKNGYNTRKIAESNLGLKHSDEAKRRIGKANKEARKGKKLSAEHRANISKSRKAELKIKGAFSKETKIKMAEAAKKHWSDPKIRNRMIIGMENRRNNGKK
jgi:hypothetical protein